MSGSFVSKSYATMDHHLGRVGTAAAATATGAAVGAAGAHLTSRSLPMGAAVGGAVGLAAEEAGRLLVDSEEYKSLRAEKTREDVIRLMKELGIDKIEIELKRVS
jgi:hypothetical protein